MADSSPGISILILTLNEEANIEGVLDSVAAFDDVVVLDSYSIDRTVELARARGARVVKRPFANWATHHNWRWRRSTFGSSLALCRMPRVSR